MVHKDLDSYADYMRGNPTDDWDVPCVECGDNADVTKCILPLSHMRHGHLCIKCSEGYE